MVINFLLLGQDIVKCDLIPFVVIVGCGVLKQVWLM